MGIIMVFAYAGVTLFAQIALALRIYAITMKNRVVIACCCLIMVSQLSVGVYLTIFITTNDADPHVLSIPIDAYGGCGINEEESLTIAFVTLSLVYDLFTFLVIMYTALRNNLYQSKILRLFNTIVQDAAYYFLIIFTSHLLFGLILVFSTPWIKLFPGTGMVVYLPVMVGRLMLSLKKAASLQGDPSRSFGEPAVNMCIGFAERRGTVATGDVIRMDTLSSGHEGSKSRA